MHRFRVGYPAKLVKMLPIHGVCFPASPFTCCYFKNFHSGGLSKGWLLIISPWQDEMFICRPYGYFQNASAYSIRRTLAGYLMFLFMFSFPPGLKFSLRGVKTSYYRRWGVACYGTCFCLIPIIVCGFLVLGGTLIVMSWYLYVWVSGFSALSGFHFPRFLFP